MQYINLSETLKVSRIIQGLMRLNDWGFNNQEALNHIEKLMDLGITTFDNADIYGNYECEKRLGEILSLNPNLRSDMQIVTKCDIKLMSDKFPNRCVKHYDTSKDYIIESANQSLVNMKTDYIDLLLIHRPDPLMDPVEVSEAFNYLYKSGKVLNFGVSNFKPSTFNLLQKFVQFPLVTNQIEISPLNLTNFDNGTIEQCQEYEIPPMAWSPLGGGSIFSSNDEKSIRVCQKLEEIAEKYSITSLDEVIYAWLLMHPATILPIVGSGKLARMEKAIQSLELSLTREDWFEIYVASLGEDVA